MIIPALVSLALHQAPQAAERLHVEWLAPQGCPDRSALQASLETSVPPRRSFWAKVRIDEPAAPGQRWRAVVITRAAAVERRRVVDGQSCERVTEAALLVVTLAATEVSIPLEPEPLPVELPSPGAGAPQAPAAEAPVAVAAAPPPDPWSPSFRVQPVLGVSAGVLPTAGLGFGGALGLTFLRLRLELGAQAWLESSTATRRRGASLSSVTFTVRGAWLFQATSALRLGPGLSVETGWLTAQGTGLNQPGTGVAAYAATLAGLTAGLELTSRLSLWVALDGGVNLTRPRFTITTEAGEVVPYQVGWPLARLTLGAELSFP